MSFVLSSISRVFGRALVIAFSGALAVGLLATASIGEARAATGTSSTSATSERQQASAPSARRVARAVDVAVAQKGDPYRYGAAGPGAFDCSGLTYFSFRKVGFQNIPRTSSAQARFAKRISRDNMKRGDLIFIYGGSGVYHVGVYAGFRNGHRMLLHAGKPGTRVRTDRLWTNKWYPGTLRHRS